MRSCTESGLLLQPSRAATTIDPIFHRMAFPELDATVSQGVVMATSSVVAHQEHGLILSAELKNSYKLPLSALFWLLPQHSGQRTVPSQYVVFESNLTTTLGQNEANDVDWNVVQLVEAKNGSILLPVSDKMNFTLHSLAPVATCGWSLLGELSKWVPVASARFREIVESSSDLSAELVGVKGEVIAVSFFHVANRSLVTVQCQIGATGRARVSAAAAKCLQL